MNNGYIPMIGRGESSITRTTRATGSTDILLQANLWVIASLALKLCALIICLLLVLTFGGLWVVGGVVVVLSTWAAFTVSSNLLWKTSEGTWRDGMTWLDAAAPVVLVLALDAALILLWPGFVAALNSRTRWGLLITFIACMFLESFVRPYSVFSRRMEWGIRDVLPQVAVKAPYQMDETTPEEAMVWARALGGDDIGSEGGLTAEEIMAQLKGSIATEIANRPIIQRTSVIKRVVGQVNGNGLHQSPAPGTDERQEQNPSSITIERDYRERDGKRVFRIVQHGKPSLDITEDTARHYVAEAWEDRKGIGVLTWKRLGLTQTQQDVIRSMLEYYGMILPANGQHRETITWLVSRDRALELFDYYFDDDPPTPLENDAEGVEVGDVV